MRKPRKSVRTVLIAVTLLAGMLAGSTAATAQGPDQSYIVVLDRGTPNVPAVAASLARAHGGQVGFVYEHAIQGFSISISPQGAAALARNPRVAYVEADALHTIAAQDMPTGIERSFARSNTNLDIDGTDDFRVDVDVAVIDTGVDFEHPDLNVVGGVNCASGGPFGGGCIVGGDDDHYHGTHVAGTIGAIDNDFGVVGVAPGARIWSVKVLSKRGSGYTSWIVAGIDWVAANAATIEVANMSLGGSGFSQAEYDAIQGAVDAGVAFAVAAGNSDANALNYSPAAFNNVLTVSALADFNGLAGGGAASTCRSDGDDTLANFSNWGPAVDIAAPGVCILSTYPLEQGSYGTISGTSMASPHVAGALALRASVSNPGNATDVGNLYSAVINAGNLNWTDDSGDGIKERLLDVSSFGATLIAGSGGGSGGSGGPTDTPPTVSITSPSDEATFASGAPITFEGSASDAEDGDLSASIAWTADGASIGSGSPVTIVLGDGEHTIIASAMDGDGNTVTDSITVTVNSSGGGGGEGGITLTATGT
ncbi:MAG TPA: S8 family serine peptidase, partial [Acidimicrobiia bacterium]|nr:S8 family serine peptidase [Acidimicrobiia bacterium]